MSAPLLACRDLHVAYDKVTVLFGVDLEVGGDEIVALLGTNGAGKSTLLKAISGLVDPIDGSILFDGRDITHAASVARAELGIVQVPGGRAVFPTLTVAEHFKVAAWLFVREEADAVQARTARALELFPRLGERWHQMAGNLSGGEQQQLAIGMAFVARPRLLIIDELSLGLAPLVVEELLATVRTINAEGCPVLLVEQSVNVALTLSKRAYFLEKGEVRFHGNTADLLDRDDLLRSVFLEGAAGNSVTESAAGAGRVPAAAAVRPPEWDPETDGSGAPVALRVRGLSKRFGGISAINDVSFDLRVGRTLGLIGPNGAGKTTIMDLVSGVLAPDGGGIELHEVEISGWPAHRRAAAGLGRSFQDARLFPSLTVADNIAIGLETHLESRDHVAALFNLPSIQRSESHVARTVEELIELLHLQAYRDKFVAELSTGSRRMVDLALSIAHHPSVLLLDEPSSGIAQRETEALGPLIRMIQRETNCAILLIEHDMSLIKDVSDQVVALDLGTVVAEGTPSEVLSDARVISTYLGGDLAAVHRSGARHQPVPGPGPGPTNAAPP